MDVNASHDATAVARVPVVAGWAVDPHEVVAACRCRAAAGGIDRVRRASGLSVREAAIPAMPSERERRGWRVLREGGHCEGRIPAVPSLTR